VYDVLLIFRHGVCFAVLLVFGPYPACAGSQNPLACCLGGVSDPSV
jgi:hypothetical protein